MNSRERQTIMPLTIRQVMTASLSEGNDNYRVDGVELHQIKLVGQIIEMEDTATNSMYTIDDGTGRTTVKMLADSDGSDYKVRAGCSVELPECNRSSSVHKFQCMKHALGVILALTGGKTGSLPEGCVRQDCGTAEGLAGTYSTSFVWFTL